MDILVLIILWLGMAIAAGAIAASRHNGEAYFALALVQASETID